MKYILIFILLGSSLLMAVDQKEVLMKEADRLSLRRQYEQAITIYKDLLQQYPQDSQIAEKLISSYLMTSQLENAWDLMQEKENIFEDIDRIRLKVTLQLASSEVKKAWKECSQFLEKNTGKLNYYKTFATLFQRYRQYEYAIELLLNARNIAGDDYLYSNELANNYLQISDYPNSIKEFLKHVEKNKAYKNYVLNKLKIVLKGDPTLITYLKDFAEASDDPNIKEIYAACLGEIGNINEALNVYQYLDSDKLQNYAKTLMQTGDHENALLAYEKYQQMELAPEVKAEAELAIAQIFWKQKKYTQTEEILLRIYNSKKLQSKQLRFKTRANRVCREMLSDLALIKGQNDQAVSYLQEAKEFTYNQKEIKDIEYRIVHFQLMTNDLDSAEKQLSKILSDEDPASEIFKKGIYYKFLLGAMKQNGLADSLLSELLINLPESDFTNDAIELSLLLAQLDKSDQEKLFTAVRYDQLYNTQKAIEILEELYQSSSLEQVLFLAGEWALRNGDLEEAARIFHQEYKDEDLAQYALLMSVYIDQNDPGSDQIAKDFLAENPKSVFAPAFRRILTE